MSQKFSFAVMSRETFTFHCFVFVRLVQKTFPSRGIRFFESAFFSSCQNDEGRKKRENSALALFPLFIKPIAIINRMPKFISALYLRSRGRPKVMSTGRLNSTLQEFRRLRRRLPWMSSCWLHKFLMQILLHICKATGEKLLLRWALESVFTAHVKDLKCFMSSNAFVLQRKALHDETWITRICIH